MGLIFCYLNLNRSKLLAFGSGNCQAGATAGPSPIMIRDFEHIHYLRRWIPDNCIVSHHAYYDVIGF